MQASWWRTYLLAVAAAMVAFTATVLGQTGASNLGTWKLNLAKSTYAPGTAPRSSVFTNVAVGTRVKTVVDTVTADGTVMHGEYTVLYDGKDNPVTGTSRNGDTAAGTRVDAHTVKFVYKKDGKVTVTQTGVVSADGKTYTLTAKGTNTLGQTINTVAVYDKQPTGPDAVQDVTALERGYIEAGRQYDIAWFERNLADSFVSTGDGVASDKAKTVANIKNRVRKIESISYEEITVQVYGDAAVAMGLTDFKGTVNGKEANRKYRWTDTWVKRNGQWQCVAGHSSTVVPK